MILPKKWHEQLRTINDGLCKIMIIQTAENNIYKTETSFALFAILEMCSQTLIFDPSGLQDHQV